MSLGMYYSCNGFLSHLETNDDKGGKPFIFLFPSDVIQKTWRPEACKF
jgi:hypothetical protein